jgi:hypothetical protein
MDVASAEAASTNEKLGCRHIYNIESSATDIGFAYLTVAVLLTTESQA